MSIAQGSVDIDWLLILQILGFIMALAASVVLSYAIYNGLITTPWGNITSLGY